MKIAQNGNNIPWHGRRHRKLFVCIYFYKLDIKYVYKCKVHWYVHLSSFAQRLRYLLCVVVFGVAASVKLGDEIVFVRQECDELSTVLFAL